MMKITVETIREYAQQMIKGFCGYITDPEHQAVVMTVYDLINYLQGEYELEYLKELEYLEGFEKLWNEDGELNNKVYFEKYEEIWNENKTGDYQEAADNYSGMTTWTIHIGDEYYFIGNIEDLEDDSLLEYATWYYDEEEEDEE